MTWDWRKSIDRNVPKVFLQNNLSPSLSLSLFFDEFRYQINAIFIPHRHDNQLMHNGHCVTAVCCFGYCYRNILEAGKTERDMKSVYVCRREWGKKEKLFPGKMCVTSQSNRITLTAIRCVHGTTQNAPKRSPFTTHSGVCVWRERTMRKSVEKNIFRNTRTCVYLYIYEWHCDTVFRVIKRIRLSCCPCVFCRITTAIVQAYACEKHTERENYLYQRIRSENYYAPNNENKHWICHFWGMYVHNCFGYVPFGVTSNRKNTLTRCL